MNAILRLELAGVVRGRFFVASLIVALGLVLFFGAMATRESAVLGFTGFGRVVTGTALASLLFLPLIALFSTVVAVPEARQQGVLEWYMSHPLSRGDLFWGLYLPRLGAVVGPVLAMVGLVGLLAAGLGRPLPWDLALRLTLLLLGQGFCFSALGLLVSVRARAPEQALARAMVLWLLAVALIDFALIGVLLRWKLSPYAVFFLAGLNPVQAGRLGILAGTDPDFGLLGPVGTWMAIHLGGAGVLTYAIGWPLLLGAGALALARHGFVRRDLM